jgi:cellulose synthase/poly-beta-1,6-N-acetylglucosamine synthase-like glycosyltransferase
VTEDADIGLRLARCGYRVSTISLPTYEEAPIRFRAWMRQRTRWFKGWMQTCLVHLREPLRLCDDLGFKGTLGFVAVQLGMILSALLHPIFLAVLAVFFIKPDLLGFSGPSWMLIFGVANLAAGYAAMIALASRTLAQRGLGRLEPALVALPLYWVLMSIATYRSLWELMTRPHYWAKTTHFGVLAAPRVSQAQLPRGGAKRA